LLLVARLLEGGGGGSGVASGCRCCCCCCGRLRVVALAVMMVRDGVEWWRCCLWVVVLLAGGAGGACGLWRCSWVVAVVGGRMQDRFLPWLLLRCHALPARPFPLPHFLPPLHPLFPRRVSCSLSCAPCLGGVAAQSGCFSPQRIFHEINELAFGAGVVV
jgi:hypothetical protein